MILKVVRRLRIQTDGKEDGTAMAGSMPYPDRPGEPDCIFCLRTGLCGYGNICRFNHPTHIGQANQLQLGGELPERVEEPDLFSKDGGVKHGWVTYEIGRKSLCTLHSNWIFIEQPYSSGSTNLPERPGEPECRYFMRTGNCRYGSDCKYHHPKEKIAQLAASSLGPLGLPLRHGQAVCSYYSLYGICKFGPTYKYDHPLMGYSYNYNMSLPNANANANASSLFPYGGVNSSTLHSSGSSPSKSSKNEGNYKSTTIVRMT
ncbi:unnamed protein product [Lactuca virosa]|uniref:C3H1-type domain-containing protein n=1 Tax=Lactuca virosa TaxID=75947 RepID=A0AAU9M8U4_9ASTR|nr:unnamed protein product [Lactuca virosa]